MSAMANSPETGETVEVGPAGGSGATAGREGEKGGDASSGEPPGMGPEAAEGGGSASEQSLPRTQGLGIALVGFVIAMWGAMCGIGGGLFAVPILHYVYKLTLRQSVVTSLSLVAATTISATLAETLRDDSRIDWWVVLCLVGGSLVGAQFGFRAAQRIKPDKLKLIFSVLLLFVGTRILGWVPQTFAGLSDASEAPALETADYALAALIGLGGGFVAPMLGIGGGLVAVPALMFAIPSLGHLGARACSMAMGTVTSTRSMVLYFRAGELNLRRSASFATGAALGAFAGVQIVHIAGVADVAKKMLAVTLLLVAARFAWDVIRNRKKSQAPEAAE